jgi:hypothetical protein
MDFPRGGLNMRRRLLIKKRLRKRRKLFGRSSLAQQFIEVSVALFLLTPSELF